MRTAGNSAAGAYRQGISGGPLGKVRCLQRLLTCSFSGKALAVKRVTETRVSEPRAWTMYFGLRRSSKTQSDRIATAPGISSAAVTAGVYSKSNGKLRPLSIPVMKDRAMQALYLMALEPVAETCADPNSYGFRKGRSTADAIEQCFKFLSKKATRRSGFLKET